MTNPRTTSSLAAALIAKHNFSAIPTLCPQRVFVLAASGQSVDAKHSTSVLDRAIGRLLGCLQVNSSLLFNPLKNTELQHSEPSWTLAVTEP